MSKLKVAIAGAGYISAFHLTGWAEQDGVEIVGLADPVEEARAARAKAFGIPAVFADTAEMLDRTKPDLVDIITPVDTHGPLVRMAADRGIDVMCQKPMAPTLAEAESLVADIGDRVRFMVHENYRFRPHYKDIRAQIANGAVGRPRQARLVVRSSSLFDYPGRTPFLLERQPYLAGFERLLVFEVLIHHLDAMRAIFGPLEVTGATLSRVNPALKGEDVALVTLRGKDGLLVQIDANISALGHPPLPTDRLEVMGDADTLVFDCTKLYLLSAPATVRRYDLEKNYQKCFSGAIAECVEALREGRPFATDRLDNLETFRLMDAVYQQDRRQEGGRPRG